VRPRLVTPAFVAVSAAVLALFVSGGLYLPVIPRFVHGPLGLDAASVGIALGSFSVSSLILRPFAGRLSDRRGRRFSLLIGATIFTAAAFGHLLVTDLLMLVVMRLLLGAGEAFFFVAALAAAADLSPDERRGEALSFMSLSIYLGSAIGPIAGELLLNAGGYAVVWIAAGVMAVLAIVLSWIAPETLKVDPAAGGAGQGSGSALIDRRGIGPGLLILCAAWGMGGYFAFLPLLVDQLGIGGASGYFAAFAIIVIALRIAFATLPDRVGGAPLAGTALAVSAIGLAVVAAVPSGTGLWIATVLFAIGTAFTFPAVLTLAVAGVPPDERGGVVGTTSLFLDVAFGLAPAVLGFLAGATGYPLTFLVSAGVAAAGSLWLLSRVAVRRSGTLSA
jgi:MFS family permease